MHDKKNSGKVKWYLPSLPSSVPAGHSTLCRLCRCRICHIFLLGSRLVHSKVCIVCQLIFSLFIRLDSILKVSIVPKSCSLKLQIRGGSATYKVQQMQQHDRKQSETKSPSRLNRSRISRRCNSCIAKLTPQHPKQKPRH